MDKTKTGRTDKVRHSLTNEGPLNYEWESAKSKPHARIISRKLPKALDVKTGEIENLFGLSRIGKVNAPKALITGRIPDPTAPKPDGRPAAYSGPPKAGEYKPNPLILSRHKPIDIGSGSGVMQNIYGLTRFGVANPPRPVIIGRHVMKDKRQPGPGAYEMRDLIDTKVGIQIKSRIPLPNQTELPGANAYDLPCLMGDGPAFSFAGRYIEDIHARSPGPIYNIRQPFNKKKGKSLTFKPFPWKQQKEFPSPNEYSCLPGNQKVETTLTRAPVVRFAGKPYNTDWEYAAVPGQDGPGPGDFNLSEYHGTSQGKPNAVITSRPKQNFAGCGSGKLLNLYGKTRFGSRRPPRCIIISRHPKKEKWEPGPGSYNPEIRADTRIGITMKSRWPSSRTAKKGSTGPGPGDYDLPSMGTGPKFSLVPKFRGEIGVLEKVPEIDYDIACKAKGFGEMEKPKENCCRLPPIPHQGTPQPNCDYLNCVELWPDENFLPMMDKFLSL